MRLFIAEKPSLARAIADVLPKPHRKGDGFIECGNGQVVTWCIGHLLEQALCALESCGFADCPGKVAITAPTLRDQTT